MLLRRNELEAIARGEVSLVFRRWKRPTVRTGGTLRTAVGVLAIDEVKPIYAAQITTADSRKAGYSSRSRLVAVLQSGREGQLYRIKLHLAGDDPRIALRKKAKLTMAEIAYLKGKLAGFDRNCKFGSWTLKVMRLIAKRPNTRAAELADLMGLEKEWLKTNIRKLKELGLTESLMPGYRLLPRGRALLKAFVGK